jgi:hypothetical protein
MDRRQAQEQRYRLPISALRVGEGKLEEQLAQPEQHDEADA